MVNIYLVRHGQTELNVRNIISGQIETDLTELGRQQALDAALKMKSEGVSFDVILSSTLKRAKDTADIIAEVIKAPIVYDENLMEFDNGDYEGMDIRDLRKKVFNPPYRVNDLEFNNGSELVEAYNSFESKYDVLAYPNGETKIQARERFMKAIQDYLNAHTEVENMAVVAHGAVIRFMILRICPKIINEKIKNAESILVYYDRNEGKFLI